MKANTTNTARENAKTAIRAAWDELTASGDFTTEEMTESLKDQLAKASQGWDAGYDSDLTDEIAQTLWNKNAEDLTDEEIEEFQTIDDEAAQEWLAANA